jgi:PKHD-type hydroxylase
MDVGGDGPMAYRKISATLLVNDDYEGGELVFQGQPEPDKDAPKLKAGTIIFFPSFLVHSVRPVTKGIRNSVVLWLHGKPYK